MDIAFVYILRCADDSFYTGLTRRPIEARLSEHNAGEAVHCYTYPRRPVQLIYSEAHTRYDEAIAAERRIKGWSRAKKIALMRADYDALQRFSSRALALHMPNLTPHAEEPPSGGVSKHGQQQSS